MSAFSGSIAAINGLFILFGRIKVEELSTGSSARSSTTPTASIAMVAMVLVAAAAIWYQLRGVEAMATAQIDRSAYRYA